MKFDVLVVGAGFAGATIAERTATLLGRRVLIIEKRNHIGGNSFDRFDRHGLLVHQYGPHIFRTDNEKVWRYLSQYTDWRHYEHKVIGDIDGKRVPIPFNLNTLSALFPQTQADNLKERLINAFGFGVKVPILRLMEHEDESLRELADFIYRKVYLNYTVKQWGMKPEDLDPSVTGRVPVFISHDDRYFQEKYQGIPRDGYTALFEKMLAKPDITILLNTDFKEVITLQGQKVYFMGEEFKGKIVFTGKIDELFDYEFGELPYRSLRFEFENLNQEYFQEVATVNYPNDHDFTRITEFKHLTGQRHFSTTIAREYPQEYDRHIEGKDIPYYPVPKGENRELYDKYSEKALRFENIAFLGRLAEYRYYSMSDVIEKALAVFEEIFS